MHPLSYFSSMFNSPFAIPIVAIICGTIITIVQGGKEKKKKHTPEETKIMQEIHQGLSRLEQRIESLETILFDKKHKGE